MIDGVAIKPLKLLSDRRGFLMEMLRSDDAIFEQFGQAYVTGCRQGFAKGWHYHKEQTDYFTCVLGRALVVLYDGREGSATYQAVEEHILEAPPVGDHDQSGPMLLKIPPLVIHGFAALGCPEARIINLPTRLYRYANPDEFRYPWNSPEIPYTWPPDIRDGG